MQSELQFYSLLFVNESDEHHANLGSSADPVSTYLRCAALCAKTAQHCGVDYAILTNSKGRLGRLSGSTFGSDVIVKQVDFSLNVPPNTKFYSAHYKIDMVQQFSTGKFGNCIGLIDLDTVFLRNFPYRGRLGVYDITAQVIAAYTSHRVYSDLDLVAGRTLRSRSWYGGELITGAVDDYAVLAPYIRSCWPRYIENLQYLHHHGDEMVMSAAINLARDDGFEIVDHGAHGDIARWWSASTMHEQISFSLASQAAVLHLPADKRHLEYLTKQGFVRWKGHEQAPPS